MYHQLKCKDLLLYLNISSLSVYYFFILEEPFNEEV